MCREGKGHDLCLQEVGLECRCIKNTEDLRSFVLGVYLWCSLGGGGGWEEVTEGDGGGLGRGRGKDGGDRGGGRSLKALPPVGKKKKLLSEGG